MGRLTQAEDSSEPARGSRRRPHGFAAARGLTGALLASWLLVAVLACEGPRGPAGVPGATGEAGPPGRPAAIPDAGERPDATVDAATPDADADAPAQPRALGGKVLDPLGPITGGRVVLIPVETVAAMAERDLTRFGVGAELADALGDEPLEDALDDQPDPQSDGFASAAVGTDGGFAFKALPTGEAFFVYFQPSDDDPAHLPGGSLARGALARDSLVDSTLTIAVSGRPSKQARYVGSESCLACHGRHSFTASAHRLGLQVPGRRGALQDDRRFPELDRLREHFSTGTVLFFAGCDVPASERARCRVTTEDPGQDVSFEIALAEETGPAGAPRLTATLRNRRGPGSERYLVPLIYGGPLGRQLPLLASPSGQLFGLRYPGPFALNLNGYLGASDPADQPFADAGSERFYDFDAGALRRPTEDVAFERRCAGCHATGYEFSADAQAASAVASLGGSFDLDGDGRLEEINVGCESCHGPGSDHLESQPRGGFIVSPSKLSASRATLICGACHGRTSAALHTDIGAPLNAQGRMPRPGMRRADFLRDHVGDVSALAEAAFASGDGRLHYQQYDDFLQSSKHRNGLTLFACDTCHDPHSQPRIDDSGEFATHELRSLGDADCMGCHSGTRDVRAHVERVTGDPHMANAPGDFGCAVCHMPTTGTRGAQQPGLLDIFPRAATPLQYTQGDVPSHRFGRYTRAEARQQPTWFNRACAVCHGEYLDNPEP